MTAALSLVVSTLPAQSLTAAGHERYAKTLERWASQFRTGRVDPYRAINSGDDVQTLFRGFLRPEGATLDSFDALELYVGAFDRHASDREARLAMLSVASLGLGASDPTPPGITTFRNLALDTLSQSRHPAVLRELLQVGSEPQDGERRDEVLQRAALLALGRSPQPVARGVLLQRLTDEDRLTRLAATVGLAGHADPRDVATLARRIGDEDDPLILRVSIDAVQTTALRHGADLRPGAAEAALWAAHARLGRLGIDVDQAIVELCGSVRSARSIPILIDLLEELESDKDRRALSSRVSDVLRSLTGAPFRHQGAATWREFWTEVSADFELPPLSVAPSDDNRTTTGFFGLRVQGARVVFLIDVSGSMNATYWPRGRTVDPTNNYRSRLQFSIDELRQVIATLPKDTLFDVIAFASVEDRLFGSLEPADKSHRRQLDRALEGLRADGGTNIYAAIDRVLPLQRTRWGEVDARPIDEIFLLSDGEPSVGEVTAPRAILDAVREANRWLGVRIHTVSMGSGGSAFLRDLAEQNGGTYIEADG